MSATLLLSPFPDPANPSPYATATAAAAAAAAVQPVLGPYMLQSIPVAQDNDLVMRAVRHDQNSGGQYEATRQPTQKAYFENELWVHKHLPRHPNVVITVDAFEDDTNTFIVREACDAQTDMLKVIAQRGRLPEDLARHFFVQVLGALDHCHRHGIVHRDIKLPSILTDPTRNKAYLAGFGYAEMVQSPNQLMHDRRGSPAYVSPEMLQNRTYQGQAADIWSLGVVLYIMLCGTYPFVDREPKALFDKIISAKIPLPTSLSPAACDLLKRLLWFVGRLREFRQHLSMTRLPVAIQPNVPPSWKSQHTHGYMSPKE